MSNVVAGCYYDGRSAQAQPAELRIDAAGLLYLTPRNVAPCHLREVAISDRIGTLDRRITFADNSVFECGAHAVIDSWLQHHGVAHSRVHRLESRTRYALSALAVVVALVGVVVTWGLPLAARYGAEMAPAAVSRTLGEHTLEALDEIAFEPSTLPAARRAALIERFGALAAGGTPGLDYQLAFRAGGGVGANAFALPDGTIVITDELVHLARNDDEIATVVLHEIGHVERRHGLRMVLLQGGLAAIVAAVLGDLNSVGSLVLALPGTLLQSSYNRALETEADDYALAKLPALGIAPRHFAEFLERLERCAPWLAAAEADADTHGNAPAGATQTAPPSAAECAASATGTPDTKAHWLNYFSTHPPTAERIARFRTAP